MSQQFHQRVSEIVSRAARLPAADQEEYIAAACGLDEALRKEVESLLEYAPPQSDLLERPISGLRPDSRITELFPESAAEANGIDLGEGQRVGAYKLLERIGQGGMGAVFLAAREDDFEKKVALKLINTKQWPSWYRQDREGQDLLRRFHNERQILAQLEHPNIASILDGGTTEDGMPYFAMEYVAGVPIDEYCDANKLSTRQRLKLFRKVCAALHVAHQNLVVHRDLKPNNILVTVSGEPKLLDFGIAKRLAHEEHTTLTGQRPMTLKYASPEQILGRRITTASDTYALGVLLYQLLTGHFPYNLEDGEFLTLAKAICGQDPRSPSSAVMEVQEVHSSGSKKLLTPELISATREGNSLKLKRHLAGDLDSIILKALAKEPEQRYGSVEQFSDDIARYLDGLPVLAREGTLPYRGGKFLKRYRFRIAVAAIFLLVLITGAVSVERARGAERQRELLSDLVEDLLDLESNSDRPLTSPEFFDRGREKIQAHLADEPELLKAFLSLIGGGDHPEVALKFNKLAAASYHAGDYEQSEGLYRVVLAMRQRLGQEGIDLVKSFSNLASIRIYYGDYEEAEKLYLRCLRLREEEYGSDSPPVAKILRSMAVLHYNQGRLQRSEALLEQALDIWIGNHGPMDSDVADAWSSLGRVLQSQNRPREAEGIFHHVLGIREELLGPDHLHVALTKKDLAAVLLDQGEIESAGRYLDEALNILRASRPDDSWEIAEAESLWGAYLMAQDRSVEALPCLLDSYLTLDRLRGPHATPTVKARQRLGGLEERGR